MRSAAFTLIELLVVISIIALLAAIAFPMFASSREQARTVACRVKIHELLLSLHNYEAEHQTLPYGFDYESGSSPPGGYIGNFALDNLGWWWFHYCGVVRDRKQMNAIRCPAKKLEAPILDRNVLYGNYGVNRSLCRIGRTMIGLASQRAFPGLPLSTGSIRHPGSTLLVVDSGYALISWWQATAEPPAPLDAFSIEESAYVPGLEINKKRTLWPGQSCDAIGGRHPNKTVNVGFADGHAELKKAADLLVEKIAEETYTKTVLWQGE